MSPHRLKTLVASALIAALCVAAVAGCGDSGSASGPATLKWYTFDEPGGSYKEAAKQCSKNSNGAYTIEQATLPADADQQREQLVRRLAAEDSDIDIMSMDVIWIAEFARAGWIKEWPEDKVDAITRGVVDGPLATARYDDKVYAAPFTSNTQLLWYRKDRAPNPPKTWDEMLRQAQQIGAKGKIQVQGSQYEGLTVWFNSVLESAGGQVLENEGSEEEEVSLGPPAVRAAEILRNVARSPAADASLSNAKEDETRLGFQKGDSSFMVNYPFVYPSAKEEAPEVFRNMAAARYPAVNEDRPSRPPLGGINLGIGAFTEHPEEAFDAVTCLRGPENQILAAQKGGLPPTINKLYSTPEIRKAYPGFAHLIRQSIADAGVRPITPAYNDVSLAIQKSLHPPRDIEPEQSIDEMTDKIDQALGSGGLL